MSKPSHDRERTAAALHALGALSPDEAETLVAALARLPAAVRKEAAALREVADDLALATPPVAPRPEVRARLLARVTAEAAAKRLSPDAGRAGCDATGAVAPGAGPGGAARGGAGGGAVRGLAALGGFHFARDADVAWRGIAPGVAMKMLTPGVGLGGRAFVLRIEPGGVVPRHEHRIAEHCYVLHGDVRLGETQIGAGDYHLAGPGTAHEDLSSDTGCLLLIVDGPPG